jgi:diguanylate cyclase (GGDEF)-like protein
MKGGRRALRGARIGRWQAGFGIQRDPETAVWRDRVEGDLVVARWVLLAAALLYLLSSPDLHAPLLGWLGVLVGALANGAILLWRSRQPPTFWVSVAAQGVDTAATLLYAAALPGGGLRYLALYTIVLILAAIRFGLLGAAASGALGVLLGLGAIVGMLVRGADARSGADVVHLAVLLQVIVVDAALLGYAAYRIREQQRLRQRAERELRLKMSEVVILNEVSNSVYDLTAEDALQIIVEIVTKVMGFERAGLFLTESGEEMFSQRYYSYHMPARDAPSPLMHMDPRLFDELMLRRDPIVIDGSQGSVEMGLRPAVQIAVPLHGDERPIGVLVADRSAGEPASPSEMDTLASLARSAGIAIENTSLHNRIKELANRDGLTNLYNHRYFQERLREIIRDSGERWPVSLLMVEVDQFKAYNDTYGHRQGDKALHSLSRALEQSTHARDGLVARYGGDEFVAILPQVGPREAVNVTREVRDQVYHLIAAALAAEGLPPITLSIGVATYPYDAREAGELIEAADRAMYAGKRAGGNQISAYPDVVDGFSLPYTLGPD